MDKSSISSRGKPWAEYHDATYESNVGPCAGKGSWDLNECLRKEADMNNDKRANPLGIMIILAVVFWAGLAWGLL